MESQRILRGAYTIPQMGRTSSSTVSLLGDIVYISHLARVEFLSETRIGGSFLRVRDMSLH